MVTSGCTDRTEEIVKDISHLNPAVKLLSEKSKRGKASAINLILKRAVGDILVLTDADLSPASDSLLKLLEPFKDEDVGAVSGRPIPLDEPNDFWCFVAHLIWAKIQNELLTSEEQQGIFFQLSGYLCAIRTGVIDHIPSTAIAEDKYMGESIRRQGYKVLYAPEAVVYIRGPKSLRDFLNQRVRVLTGHLQIKNWFNMKQISTSSPSKIIPALVHNLNFKRPKELLWTGLAAILEFFATIIARSNYASGRLPYNWQTVPTTKPKRKTKTDVS